MTDIATLRAENERLAADLEQMKNFAAGWHRCVETILTMAGYSPALSAVEAAAAMQTYCDAGRTLAAEVERVTREQADKRSWDGYSEDKALTTIRRRYEAARQDVARLREALEPFTRGPDSEARNEERLGFCLSSSGRFTFGDFRRARRVLASIPEAGADPPTDARSSDGR